MTRRTATTPQRRRHHEDGDTLKTGTASDEGET
jgi:hypothetical protein